MKISVTTLVSLLALVLLSGCDRNTEPFVEGEQPRSPDLARIFPESDGAARPGMGPPAQPGPQRGAPPIATRAPAAQPQPQAQPQTTGGGETISGTLSVSGALEGSVPPDGMLFIIARAAGVSGGPPMAVLRVPSPRFPMEFELGPANVMIPSMRFEGDIGITARLDSDGNAMTKLPGDLEGATRESHRPGDTGVAIVLDQKL